MTSSTVVQLIGQALVLTAKLAGPFLLANVVVGLLFGVVQSVFGVQEQSLSFVPKLAVSALIVVLMGHWMIGQLTDFTDSLFGQVPHQLAGP